MCQTPFCSCAGPFIEQDGSYFPPAFVQTYVMVVALLLSVICPSIAFSYLVWSNRAGLAICTLGVYLLETAAQLISETAFVRKGLQCYSTAFMCNVSGKGYLGCERAPSRETYVTVWFRKHAVL